MNENNPFYNKTTLWLVEIDKKKDFFPSFFSIVRQKCRRFGFFRVEKTVWVSKETQVFVCLFGCSLNGCILSATLCLTKQENNLPT